MANSDDTKTLHSHALLIQSLMSHEGWALFDAMLAQCESGAYSKMMITPDAHNAAKHMGAFDAIHQIRGWAQRELAVVSARLQEQ